MKETYLNRRFESLERRKDLELNYYAYKQENERLKSEVNSLKVEVLKLKNELKKTKSAYYKRKRTYFTKIPEPYFDKKVHPYGD